MDGDEFEPTVWDTAFTAQPFATTGGAVVSTTFVEETLPATGHGSGGTGSGDLGSHPVSDMFDRKSEAQLLAKISDPERHGDSLDAYITYAITTQTSLSSFASPKCTVRRRYQDFLWLRAQLMKDHPAVILPPLPEKNRLEYLDRFSPEFLARRQAALQRFLDRVCSHPILYKSDVLRSFLESKAAAFETAKQLKRGAVFEDLSDTLMNSFSKLKRPNDRFVAVGEYIDKFEENLYALERLHLRITKRQSDMIVELSDVGSAYTLLSGNESLSDEALRALGASSEKRAQILKIMNENMQLDFLERVRDYLLYCQSIKTVLRTRDYRQMEYEDLSEMLTQTLAERDRLIMGGGSSNMLTSTWTSLTGGSGKTEEQLKQERLDALNTKLKELEETVKNSGDSLKAFNLLVMQELDMFNRLKTDEFKMILRDYARIHSDYYNKSAQEWEAILPAIESIGSDK